MNNRAIKKSMARDEFDLRVKSGLVSAIDLRNESSIFSALDLKNARLGGKKIIRLDAPVKKID